MATHTSRFIVAASVQFSTMEAFSTEAREAMRADPHDVALMRPGSRARAKIVNAATAGLLRQFQRAQTIPEAVIAYSRQNGLDPEATLVSAFPFLSDLLHHGFLIRAEESGCAVSHQPLSVGTRVGSFSVVRPVRILDDTEIYEVRDEGGRRGALKIVGATRGDTVVDMLHREARVLAHLGGRLSPAFFQSGIHDGREFVAMEWRAGQSLNAASRRLHIQPLGPDKRKLLHLACSVLDTYVALHALGVLHGDVHAQNVLVDDAGAVTIIDFGLACHLHDMTETQIHLRGGVAEAIEPELLGAQLLGTTPPTVTEASDQYAIAAMLYRLFTRCSHVGSGLEEGDIHRRILEEPPINFAAAGCDAWPDVEATLAIALAKHPEKRFGSLASFAARMREARIPRQSRRTSWYANALDAFARRTRLRIGLDGELLVRGQPTGTPSVAFGAAGLAWTAYRLACLCDDAALLTAAEVWLHRAREVSATRDAFVHAEIGLTDALIGDASLLHARAGLHCVEAAIASAYQDAGRRENAIQRFVRASGRAGESRDLSFGAAGTLLGCAVIRDSAWPGLDKPSAGLDALAGKTFDQLTAWITSDPPTPRSGAGANLGMAHGWAGALYAMLRWTEADDGHLPSAAIDRLYQVGACAEPDGRGVRWQWIDPGQRHMTPTYMPGWCNGSAGFVYLWTAAHRRLGDQRFLALAEGSAQYAAQHGNTGRNLCCGLAGRAYALIHLFGYTNDSSWLKRAKALAVRAALGEPSGDEVVFPDSLMKGEMGLGLLAADLEVPREAHMPFFDVCRRARKTLA